MLSAVILVNPALDRDVPFDNTGKVLCVHNRGDAVVGWASLAPFSHWGPMGKDGADGSQPNITNIDAGQPPPGLPSLHGHSALFEPHTLPYWGPHLAQQLRTMTADGATPMARFFGCCADHLP
jgi:hypothetical protein